MGASTRNISLAVTAAVVFHVLLLTQKLIYQDRQLTEKKPLSVTLFEEKAKPPKAQPVNEAQPLTEPEAEKVEPTVIRPKAVLPPVDKFIIATKPGNEPEPKVVVQISQQSTFFKNWLKSETGSFTSKNPTSVDKFSQTFEAPPPKVDNSKEFTSHNRENIPRGSGVFILENKGKITCGLKIDSLLSGDNSSGYVYRDCTPKKKFDLKLNQPNNGGKAR